MRPRSTADADVRPQMCVGCPRTAAPWRPRSVLWLARSCAPAGLSDPIMEHRAPPRPRALWASVTCKIMASGPITSWEIDGETVETVSDFIFWGSKITADGDCSQEIKRHLLLGRKVMTNLLLLLLSHFSRVRPCATP